MRLSIIIPTWCEANTIVDAIDAAACIGDEVIVADAHSRDGTAALARRAGARVVTAPKGRGHQLHAGASVARGDVLLFLHADARLPQGARRAIERTLSDPRVDGGNFRLRFVPDSGWARFFSWANDVRRRWMRIYYGDSALFLRRRAYVALGGFKPLPIMEDYDLVRRLERVARTSYVRDVEVAASARRFQGAPLATLALWALVQTLYTVGIPPRYLARLYRPSARSEPSWEAQVGSHRT